MNKGDCAQSQLVSAILALFVEWFSVHNFEERLNDAAVNPLLSVGAVALIGGIKLNLLLHPDHYR